MKRKPSTRTLPLKRVDQLKALGHPLRYRLFERLVIEPGSPKAVAIDMGLNETRLYHHFGVLERAGLIKRVRSQRKRGAIERIYAATAQHVELDRNHSADVLQPGASVAQQVLNTTAHEIEQCEAHARAESRDPDLTVTRLVLRLSPARATELENKLQALLANAQRDDANTPQQEYHLTLAYYAATPRPSIGAGHDEG